MRASGRSVVRIERRASGGPLAALVELRDADLTRTMCIGLQRTSMPGRYAIAALAKTRIQSGRRDYIVLDTNHSLAEDRIGSDATLAALESFAAGWPSDRPLFVFEEILEATSNLSPRVAAQYLLDEEMALIDRVELSRWYAYWVGRRSAPLVDRQHSVSMVHQFFGRRVAAATAVTAALAAAGCSSVGEYPSADASRSRYAPPVSFHMHQPGSAPAMRSVAPPSEIIPRSTEGMPLALHMHQPGSDVVAVQLAEAKARAADTVASRSTRNAPGPMAFHLHQPMAPLALADLTTASRPVGPRTASAEPVSTGPVLSSEPARAPLIVAPLHTTPVQPPTVLDGASLALAPSQIGAAARATEAPARPAASSATVRPATIFFGRGVAALSAPELQLLSQVVAELRADQRLVLTGRTDLTGSQRANEQLGLARAGRVKAALVKLGVEAERIDVRVDTSGRQGLIKNVRFVRQPGDLAAQLRRVDIEVVR